MPANHAAACRRAQSGRGHVQIARSALAAEPAVRLGRRLVLLDRRDDPGYNHRDDGIEIDRDRGYEPSLTRDTASLKRLPGAARRPLIASWRTPVWNDRGILRRRRA